MPRATNRQIDIINAMDDLGLDRSSAISPRSITDLHIDLYHALPVGSRMNYLRMLEEFLLMQVRLTKLNNAVNALNLVLEI